MKGKRILVAPLDWGLGHATRCVPIINELLAKNFEVIIAADNRPAELLKKEFPHLQHIRFPGYTIVYPVNGNMAWTMIKQLPKIFKGIIDEHRMIDTMISEYQIDAIISDNRWGAFSKRIPCLYLAHQLRIRMSKYMRWAQGLVDFTNRMLIKPFSEVWIPDVDSPDNLTGELSHGITLPKNSFYIGPLSRLHKVNLAKKDLDVLVVLSGPEPQRTIFESMIIEQLLETTLRAMVVQGTPEREYSRQLSEHLTVVSYLTSPELSKAIASADIIVSRSGHSTIMDLCFVGVNAVFVPTPQQTEQEYLAKRLKDLKFCYSESQSSFSLVHAIQQSKQYSGLSVFQNDLSLLRQRIDSLLIKLS